MSPSEFYDLSFTEWHDAVEGLKESLGQSGPGPATSRDLDKLAHLMGPSPSVRH